MESKESRWISEHQEIINKYSGKWIAVLGNRLVGVADSIEEIQKILHQKHTKELALITKVPRQDEEMSIL